MNTAEALSDLDIVTNANRLNHLEHITVQCAINV